MFRRATLGAAAATVVALLLPLLLPDTATQDWRYERAPLAAGEWWRWFSAHLVHLDSQHALVNALAAGILVVLFNESFAWRDWFGCIVAALLAIDAGLWWFAPEVDWYVGASGVLHGVMAAGCWAWWVRRDPRWWILAALLGAKLVFEQSTGAALGFSGGQPVVLAAHLYGSVGGLLGILATRASASISARLRSRPQR